MELTPLIGENWSGWCWGDDGQYHFSLHNPNAWPVADRWHVFSFDTIEQFNGVIKHYDDNFVWGDGDEEEWWTA